MQESKAKEQGKRARQKSKAEEGVGVPRPLRRPATGGSWGIPNSRAPTRAYRAFLRPCSRPQLAPAPDRLHGSGSPDPNHRTASPHSPRRRLLQEPSGSPRSTNEQSEFRPRELKCLASGSRRTDATRQTGHLRLTQVESSYSARSRNETRQFLPCTASTALSERAGARAGSSGGRACSAVEVGAQSERPDAQARACARSRSGRAPVPARAPARSVPATRS